MKNALKSFSKSDNRLINLSILLVISVAYLLITVSLEISLSDDANTLFNKHLFECMWKEIYPAYHNPFENLLTFVSFISPVCIENESIFNEALYLLPWVVILFIVFTGIRPVSLGITLLFCLIFFSQSFPFNHLFRQGLACTLILYCYLSRGFTVYKRIVPLLIASQIHFTTTVIFIIFGALYYRLSNYGIKNSLNIILFFFITLFVYYSLPFLVDLHGFIFSGASGVDFVRPTIKWFLFWTAFGFIYGIHYKDYRLLFFSTSSLVFGATYPLLGFSEEFAFRVLVYTRYFICPVLFAYSVHRAIRDITASQGTRTPRGGAYAR